MHVFAFENPRVADLEPITLSRPAFAINCGSYSLLEQLRSVGGPLAAVTRSHLGDLLAADDASLADVATWRASARASPRLTVLANARLVPSTNTLATLHDLMDGRREGVVWSGDQPAAALLRGDQLPELAELTCERLSRWLAECELPRLDATLTLLEYPHDVVRHHLTTLADNLADRIRRDQLQEIADGVFASGRTELGSYVVTDTSAGPIVLGEDVKIGPFSFLQGPLYIASEVRIREHASIRQYASIGATCKIGGEVEASIVEEFSSKQHYGYLGHSYVGRFVNLGAGTTTSNLKNTYGMVRIRRGHRKIDTGMQFLGGIVGDFAKTAINTSIYTGKTIGVGSLVYGAATENVPSFVNYARAFGQVTEVTVEAAATMQQRMFQRRGIEQRPCDVALLGAIHAMTADERPGIAGQTSPPQF